MEKNKCWICENNKLNLIRKSTLPDKVESANFQITNSDYGVTGNLYKCNNCGFIQCHDFDSVIDFYEDLEDATYEKTRQQRKLQEAKIISVAKKIKPKGRLLDVGAGSGILVECALEQSYDAMGVEPSKWLYEKAKERNLPVIQGVFPHNEISGKFDVITLIDVIEHVDNPKELFVNLRKALNDDGILLVVTPNVNSFVAKLLGKRWWHFRVAHIGYFNKKTFKLLGELAGLSQFKRIYPGWYFPLGYLWKRVFNYLPKFLFFRLPKKINKKIISLNLYDSMLVVFKKAQK